jgi:Tfp pilus assembly protein PilV
MINKQEKWLECLRTCVDGLFRTEPARWEKGQKPLDWQPLVQNACVGADLMLFEALKREQTLERTTEEILSDAVKAAKAVEEKTKETAKVTDIKEGKNKKN